MSNVVACSDCDRPCPDDGTDWPLCDGCYEWRSLCGDFDDERPYAGPVTAGRGAIGGTA